MRILKRGSYDMGMTWTDLTEEELCDLMCGAPEEDPQEEEIEE